MLDGLMIGWAIKNAIENTNRSLASVATERLETEGERLRRDFGHLALATEGIWLLLKEHYGFTDEQLAAKIREVDLRDGHIDGHPPQSGIAHCKQCGRALMKGAPRCVYCGTENTLAPFPA